MLVTGECTTTRKGHLEYMPNWCHNYVSVTGAEKDLVEFYTRLEKQPARELYDFSVLDDYLPIPAEVLAQGHSVAASWRLENWGCNGDLGVGLERSDRSFHFSLETPWAPPIPGLLAISKLANVRMVARWFVPDMSVRGHARVNRGVLEEYREWQARGWRR